jgi:hypothetical protein
MLKQAHCRPGQAMEIKRLEPKLRVPHMPVTVEELNRELREVALQVTNAEDRKDERDVVAAAHESVARISERYRELVAALGDAERLQVERTLGRRVQDIKRAAALLPRIGVLGGTTPDRQGGGPSVAGERRVTGVSWGAGQRASGSGGLRVGGEVEAWCGPCGGLMGHTIVAMLGSEPKQVVCEACGNRHNYRTTPARRTGEGEEGEPRSPAEAETQRQSQRKEDELRALAKEVALADDVIAFDPKARYKPGQIISHPVHGRGKVETVLRSSMLVRFAKGGLKSVMLE